MAYESHNWEVNEAITRNKMNHIEQGIAGIDTQVTANAGNIEAINTKIGSGFSGGSTIATAISNLQEAMRSVTQLDVGNLAREVANSHNSLIKESTNSTVYKTYDSLSSHLNVLDAIHNEIQETRDTFPTLNLRLANLANQFQEVNNQANSAYSMSTFVASALNATTTGNTYETLAARLNGMDSDIVNSLNEAKTYTNNKVGSLGTAASAVEYVEARLNTGDKTAKGYTDDAISAAVGDLGIETTVQGYVNSQTQAAKNYADGQIGTAVQNLTSSFNIGEINDAHRASGDTLDARFDDIEHNISHVKDESDANDKGGLTQRITGAEGLISALVTNVNAATTAHSYNDLDARFTAIETALGGITGVSSTVIISLVEFENIRLADSGDPDIDYIVGPDANGLYYYYKWIEDSSPDNWKLISGGSNGGGSGTSSAAVVDTLPTVNIDPNTDYYLAINNGYRHYRYIDGDWVLITPEVVADVNSKLTNYNTRIGSLETAIAQAASRVTSISAHTAKDYTFNYYIDNDANAPQEVTLKAPTSITDIELSQDQTKLTITDSAGDSKEINLPQGGGSATSGGFLSANRVGDMNLQVLANTDCDLSFTITAKEASGDALTGVATAQWIVDGEVKETTTVSANFKPGMAQTEENRVVNTFNIAPYLHEGVNSVRVKVYKNTGGETDSMNSTSWSINLINFSVVWNYDDSTIQDGSKIQFRWTPYGANIEKTTHIYIDEGTENEKHYTSTTNTNALLQTLEVDNDLTHGTHLAKMYITGVINGVTETSTPVVHAIIAVNPASSVPIVSTNLTEIDMVQYDTVAIPLVIYNPTKLETNASLYVNDTLIDTWENVNRNTQYWYYTPNLEGTHTLRVTSGTASAVITVNVSELDLEGVQEIGGYDFKLKASDFASNNALQNWTFGNNQSLVFSNNFDWTNGGIKTEIDDNRNVRQFICVKAGSTLTIPYQLFASDVKSTGADVKMIFKVVHCSNYDAQIVDCVTTQEVYNTETQQNETQYTGFKMNAHSALLGGASKSITTQFGEDEYTELEFEVYRKNANAADYMMLWVDGVMSSARAYTDAENFVQSTPKNIVIGSPYCDVYIYLIKIYKDFLDREGHLANFIADAPNATEIALRYNRNDILDEMNEISPEKLADKNPNCRVWKYDIPRMTHAKDDKVANCGFEQIFKGGTEDDQLRGVGTIAVQGTSSVNYRYGAANTDIDFSNGELYTVTRSGGSTVNVKNLLEEETPGFKLSANALPITYANMKVNFASCEQVNNMCNAEWYDRFQPYPSLSNRDCMEFHMGVQFIRDAHAEGEQINLFNEKDNYDANKYYMYSIGNLGNSKKNTDVFHSAKECCIEIKENTSDAQRMITYDSTWTQEGHDSNYEMRYPKLNKTTQAMRDGWERFVTWMVASNPNGATGAALSESVTFAPYTFRGHNRTITNKEGHHYEQVLRGLTIDRFAGTYTHDTFNYRMAKMLSECEDYMAMDSIIYHFCFIERHTMVDNVAKNTFWSANETNQLINGEEQDDTAGYWIWDLSKNYDNDTSDGNNNNGLLVFDYGNEATDTYREGTTAVFNGNNSVWFVFASNLYEACQRMFINRETYGAWNSKLYHAYLTSEQRKVPERVWNECYWYDYLRTYESSNANMQKTWINFLDGGQKIHQRSHFETYQEIYMSSKYLSPFSRNQSITIRGEDVENENLPAAKTEFVVTMFNKCYLTIHIGTNEKTVKCQKGVPVTIAFYKNEEHPEQGYMSLSNSVIDIDSGSMVQAIGDLSLLYPSSCQFGSAIRLRSLTIGSNTISGYYNPNMTSTSEITLDNPILEELIIQNLPYANYTLNLSQCPELATVNASGSSFTGYVFANGGKLTYATLERPTALVLKNLNLLQNTNLVINNYAALTTLQIENCKLLDELALVNSATNLQTARLVGLDWYNANKLVTNTPLERLLAMSGLDYNGFNISQSYLSGRIDLDPTERIPRAKVDAYKEAWEPDLTLNIDDSDIIPQYKVEFYDEDGVTRLSQYDYYVGPVDYLYDPVYGNSDSGIAPKTAPVKPMSVSETYIFGRKDGSNNYIEFSGWKTLTGDTSMSSISIDRDTQYKAVYTTTPREYIINWYSGDTLVDTQSVAYGDEAVTTQVPSNTYNSSTQVARVFAGWDKSSGYITGNLDINAIFDEGALPTRDYLVANGLSALSPAQIYALGQIDNTTRLALLNSGNDSLIQDDINITLGNDFNFSNVISNSLITEPVFFDTLHGSNIKVYDGTKQLPNLQLLNSDDAFTLVLDYKFKFRKNGQGADDPSLSKGILASCYEYTDGHETGFKLFYDQDINGYHTMVSWGSSTNTIATGGYYSTTSGNNQFKSFYRDVVVLRKPKNSRNLYVYYTAPSRYYGEEVSSIILSGNNDDIHTTMPLVLGARRMYNVSAEAMQNVELGDGIIYWAKLWHDDLGDSACKSLASWSHETIKFELEGFNDGQSGTNKIIPDRLDTGASVNLTFLAANTLGDKNYYNAGPVKANSNGWLESDLRDYCNGRIYKSIPQVYRSIIKPTPTYSYGKAYNSLTGRYEYVTNGMRYSTGDNILIPSVQETYTGESSHDAGIPFNLEAIRTIPWFISPKSNPVYRYTGTGSPTMLQPSAVPLAYNKIRFKGRTIASNATFFNYSINPITNNTIQVKAGDIWIPMSNSYSAYMYIIQDEIDAYGLPVETGEAFACPNGGWLAADFWQTRSLVVTDSMQFELFYDVAASGLAKHNYMEEPYKRDTGLCLQFSV